MKLPTHVDGERYLSIGIGSLASNARTQAAAANGDLPSTPKIRALLAQICALSEQAQRLALNNEYRIQQRAGGNAK